MLGWGDERSTAMSSKSSSAVTTMGIGAWLGLVPRQMSTGDRTILGKIGEIISKAFVKLALPGNHLSPK
jgi:hypothetical protein